MISNALGVVRQMLLNALFGTGPQANAFYAAAQLPNTLFNLIAGGALPFVQRSMRPVTGFRTAKKNTYP